MKSPLPALTSARTSQNGESLLATPGQLVSFPDCISASAACPAGQTPFCHTSCKVPLPFIDSYCQPQIHPLQPHTFMSFRCAFPVRGLFPTPDYLFLIFFELKNLTDPSFHRRPETSSGKSFFYFLEQYCQHP